MTRVTVRNIGKKYKRYYNRWQRIAEWISTNNSNFHQELWVLRGITFSVSAGESVGIIGQNGAGKSTLLKILTGTTEPSEGSFALEGKVSALLELGMGFHPDFTGRQNAFLTAQIMGFSNDEIVRMMPEIEDFSEIGDYMDQPLRTYSSGMVVRLAFATATAFRPDILIVDEALSVGDAYFQFKCFDRIRRFRDLGTTLLFVSHDPGAVKNLCDRAILLDRGLMIKEGNPDEVLDYYNALIAKQQEEYAIEQSRGYGQRKITRSGNGAAYISSVQIIKNNMPVSAIQVGEIVEVHVEVEFNQEIHNPTVGILFKDRLGNEIFGTNTYHLGMDLGTCFPGDRKKVTFELPVNFGVGNYSLTVAIHAGYVHTQGNYDWWEQALILQVIPGKEYFTGFCYLPILNTLITQIEKPLKSSSAQEVKAFADSGDYLSAGNPNGTYLASLHLEKTQIEMLLGDVIEIPVILKNLGNICWRSFGEYPIFLSFHLLDSNEKIIAWDNPRFRFASIIKPGQELEIYVKVDTAIFPSPGQYVLEFDLVCEGLTWFAEKGSPTAKVIAHVKGGLE